MKKLSAVYLTQNFTLKFARSQDVIIYDAAYFTEHFEEYNKHFFPPPNHKSLSVHFAYELKRSCIFISFKHRDIRDSNILCAPKTSKI